MRKPLIELALARGFVGSRPTWHVLLICAGVAYPLEAGMATKREAQRRLAEIWKSMKKDEAVWTCLRQLWERWLEGRRRALRGGTS
jgi:hypothetical protein